MIKDFKKTAIIAGERYVSYDEMLRRISHFGQLTVKGKGQKTLLLSENREGWIYVLFAVWKNRGVLVPVDATATSHDVAYIINDCKPDCIWTTKKKVETAKEAMKELGVEIPMMLIDEYEQAELDSSIEPAKIAYDTTDTALIIYTSGTTGNPKGVMLSFENLIANVDAVSKQVPIFTPETRTLVLLPLHHVLPLLGSVVAPITTGGGVAICPSMAAADLMQTLSKGKVSIIIGVPRLYQTLFRGIKNKINANFVTRSLFNMCESLQWRWLSRLVFGSVRKKMGGRIKFCVSGGAALDKEIGVGLKTLGLDVLEGYGMTETAPMIAFTRPDDILPGSVGLPLPSVQVLIKNGEICAKGPNVMQGYFNRPKETAEMFDEDGWLHTGDLGSFDEKGRLYITGRTKEIIVLSNGKNVNPSEIEFKIEKYSDKVKEAGIVQDGDMLRAIIVPQPEWIAGRDDEQLEEALKREVLEPYNETVAPYKKLMSLFVYRGDLPRTKLDKLQRFKLPGLITAGEHTDKNHRQAITEPAFPEYKVIKQYIRQEKNLPVRPTDHLETDLAFDSLDKVGLQGFIEQTFGMEMAAEKLQSFRNVLELAEWVSDYKTRIEVEDIDWNKILNEESNHLNLPGTWPDDILIAWMFKAWFKLYHRIESKGKHNIPDRGPFILASNHQSFIDGMLVVSFVQTHHLRHTYFFAKEKHVRRGIVSAIASRHNVIVMEPSNLKVGIQRMGEALKKGENIIIFPEGTRTENGEVGEFKKTFAILSKELNVPIVPVSIHGAYEAMPKHAKVARPGKILVKYLKAITPKADESYEQLAERVRMEIVKDQRNSR